MNHRFTLLFAVGIASLASIDTAEAGRWRFGGGGGGGVRVHAHASGGVSVRYARPAYRYPARSWSVGGHIYVGNTYPRYRYYRPYYIYTPVPSYYGYYTTNTYYPVAPAATTVTTTVVAPARPELPKFGVGLFAGGVSVEDQQESSDLGLLARFRLTPGLLIEGELGKTSYANDLRVDRRLGASLVYEIGAYNKFAPYVLAGIGAQQADVGGGQYTTTQNFAEVGIGLRYAISPRFHLLGDIRAGSRDTMSEDGTVDATARMVTPPAADSSESEEYTRARLSAVVYF